MGVYITTSDCSNRLSAAVMVQIFDDNNDGTADAGIVADFISDSEALIEQSIAKTYGEAGLTALRAQGTNCPRSIKRLCLDAFQLYAERRHPEYIRSNWDQKLTMLREDLKSLRMREIELDVIGSPEPADNEGCDVESGDPDDTDPKDKFALDGMGIF